MKYQIVNNKGLYKLLNENNDVIAIGRSIGINNFNNLPFSDSFSVYNKRIDDYDRIYLGNSLTEQRMISIGNIDEVYNILNQVIKKNYDKTFVDKCASVLETVNFYFGGFACASERLAYFPLEKDVSTGNVARGKLSSIKKKNVALGEERAILSQNLLQYLGYDSLIKFSLVNICGEQEEKEIVHAYNLIQNDNKYYLFDATYPTLTDGRMSPIIMELDKDIFDNLAYPLNDDKEILKTSVDVEHFDPLSVQFIKIRYNSNIIDVKQKVKR